MKLRLTLALLLLANIGYFTWSQGYLARWPQLGDWANPAPQREPERMDRQIQAQRLVPVRAPQAPAPAPTATAQTASTPPTASPPPEATEPVVTVCLQANNLPDAQTEGLQRALGNALPAGSWQIDTTVQAARWVVYLGKFANTEALRTRKAELRAAKVDHRDVVNPSLQPGLALGTFPTEALANQALRDITRNNPSLKNAKVVAERPESRQHSLKLPQATNHILDTVRLLNGGLPGAPELDLQVCDG